jgi:hypothetical protein
MQDISGGSRNETRHCITESTVMCDVQMYIYICIYTHTHTT